MRERCLVTGINWWHAEASSGSPGLNRITYISPPCGLQPHSPHYSVTLLPTHFLTFKTPMVESSGSPTTSPDVISVAAPLLFGVLFNWTLFGVLCVQIYVYSYNFRTDRRIVKILVYFVFLLETIQTALTGADIYYWFVAGFGNVERLGNSHFFPVDVPIIGTVIAFIVQGYFCYRIWVLNKRTSLRWICWIISVAAVTESAAGIWATIKPLMDENYATPKKTSIYLWAISSALADILIVVAMTLLLRRASGNFSSFVLIRVVRLTIETNALSGTICLSETPHSRASNFSLATLVITTLVLFVAFPNERYYTYTIYVFGKVYSNTLLVSLNNRIYLRDHQSPEHEESASPHVLDGARATVTTLRVAIPEPRPRALGGISPRSVIPRPVDLDNGRRSDASTNLNWSLVCAFSHHNCYPIPTFLNDPVSLSSPTLRNVIDIPKIPSGWWALATQRTRRMHFDESLPIPSKTPTPSQG
ncbi:hypothetical protein EDB84DRAFT_1636373 [Lactarius hengduanensis]|nr:hypothetical protein EDB84DRAFT_1636373 [Lactarius hengduanensis]